jgi:Endonuclease-reverse transcriptase
MDYNLQFCNIRGLNGNYISVQAHLSNSNPAILALSETQTHNNSDPSLFAVAGYHFEQVFSHKRGVALYIRNDVAYQILDNLNGNRIPEFNYIWAKFIFDKRTIYFCFIYRSPSTSPSDTVIEFDNLSYCINSLIQNDPSSEIVIAGDFNVHNAEWLLHSSNTTEEGRFVELFCSLNNLTQIINEPTRIPDVSGHRAATLDLFLTSNPDIFNVSVDEPLGNSDHCLISTSFSVSSSPNLTEPPKKKVWKFQLANWDKLNCFFKGIDWASVFHRKDVDLATDFISKTILYGMKLCIPCSMRSARNISYENNWFNSTCRQALNKKKEAYKVYQASKSEISKNLFKQASKYARRVLRHEKFIYDQNVRNNLFRYPSQRNFWSFVKHLKGNSKSATPPLINNGVIYKDPQEKANLFAKIFAENATLPPSSEFQMNPI